MYIFFFFNIFYIALFHMQIKPSVNIIDLFLYTQTSIYILSKIIITLIVIVIVIRLFCDRHSLLSLISQAVAAVSDRIESIRDLKLFTLVAKI